VLANALIVIGCLLFAVGLIGLARGLLRARRTGKG